MKGSLVSLAAGTAVLAGAIAAAVAGALAGNAIQNRTQANNGTYRLTVRLEDGRSTVVTQEDLGGIREGSYVRIYNGRAWAR